MTNPSPPTPSRLPTDSEERVWRALFAAKEFLSQTAGSWAAPHSALCYCMEDGGECPAPAIRKEAQALLPQIDAALGEARGTASASEPERGSDEPCRAEVPDSDPRYLGWRYCMRKNCTEHSSPAPPAPPAPDLLRENARLVSELTRARAAHLENAELLAKSRSWIDKHKCCTTERRGLVERIDAVLEEK